MTKDRIVRAHDCVVSFFKWHRVCIQSKMRAIEPIWRLVSGRLTIYRAILSSPKTLQLGLGGYIHVCWRLIAQPPHTGTAGPASSTGSVYISAKEELAISFALISSISWTLWPGSSHGIRSPPRYFTWLTSVVPVFLRRTRQRR